MKTVTPFHPVRSYLHRLIMLEITILLSFALNEADGQIISSIGSEADSLNGKIDHASVIPESELTADSIKSSVVLGGIGFGYLMKGAYMGLNFKFVSPDGWGVKLDFKTGASKTQNLPADYNFLFYPMDRRTTLTLNAIRLLTRNAQTPRFSVEAGPSLVSFSNTIIYPNPDYDPYDPFHLSKYHRTTDVNNVFGFTAGAETEIPLRPFMVIDISVSVTVNRIQTFVGVGINLGFGDAED